MNDKLKNNKLDNSILEKVSGGTGGTGGTEVNNGPHCECGGVWRETQIWREYVGNGMYKRITETRCDQCDCKKGTPSPVVVRHI